MSIKRIISLIAALSLIFTLGAGYAEETVTEEAATVAAPVTETKTELTLAGSVALGLGAIDAFIPEHEMTVGEFAKIVDTLAPNGGIAQKYFKTDFYNNGIKRLTAIATMCDILGYSIFFSTGDINNANATEVSTIAAKFDLSDGVGSDLEGIITMDEATQLLLNTLEAVTLDTTFKADGTTESKISKDKYMEKVLNMYLIDGIVETTSFSSLNSYKGTEDAFVVISGETYSAEQGMFEEFIGMSVKALIVYGNSKVGKVLSMFNTSRKVVELAAKDLAHSAISSRTIGYWNENDKKVTVSLSPSVDVLYNYSLFPDYTAEDLKLEQGRLILIDNNNDSAFDVVKVEDYQSMQIFSASVDSKTISNEKGDVISIAEMIEFGYPIYEKGEIINAVNIPLGAVATVYVNKNGEAVRLYITEQTAAGTVNKFNKDKNTVTLEGKDYIYAKEIKEEIEKAPGGSIITVKLNHYGEIAYFEVSKDTYLYGYMITFDEGDGMVNPRVKMFTQLDEIIIYDTKDNIILNGVKMPARDAFKHDLKSGMWDYTGKLSQMVRYKANSDGEITAICTTSKVDPGDGSRLVVDKDDALMFFSGPLSFGDDVRLDIYTKVFKIPTDLSLEDRYDYGTHKILSSGQSYTVQIFEVDDDCYAGVVMVRIDAEKPEGSDIDEIGGDSYIVLETGEFIADNSELSVYVVARALGSASNRIQEIKFMHKDVAHHGVTAKDLKVGDIFQTSVNLAGTREVVRMLVWYRHGITAPFEEVKQQWRSASNVKMFYSDGFTYASGTIKKIVKNGFIINHKPTTTADYENWNRVITTKGNTTVSIVEDGVVYNASVSDLQVNDRVFALYRDGLPREIIIYR